MKSNPSFILPSLLLLILCSCAKEPKVNQEIKDKVEAQTTYYKAPQDENFPLDSITNTIQIDTLSPQVYLYGIGVTASKSHLISTFRGESFTSTHQLGDVIVQETDSLEASYYLYSFGTQWSVQLLSEHTKTIDELASYFKKQSFSSPILFKLVGEIEQAVLENPSSKSKNANTIEEWNQSLIRDTIKNQKVTIIGFYNSKANQNTETIFHSPLEAHLINKNENMAGRLKEATFSSMNLYLPISKD